MKKILGGLIVLSLAVIQPASAAELSDKPLTLADCYALALKQSEAIGIRQELIVQTEARFKQAFSGVLPTVTFSSTDTRQDGTSGSAFTLKHVPERKFTATQPLFAGFKEFAAMKASKAEGKQRQLEKERAEQLLLVDVADAFFLLIQQREDIRALAESREALTARIGELKQRERIGRSRSSELVSAQAQIYRLDAEIAAVRNRENAAHQLLQFLTGRERIDQIADTQKEFPPTADERSYLMKAPIRPDVKAAEEAVEVTKQQVRIAKGDYFPTASLEGNYYVERAGVAKDVDWTAALKVEVPIFNGGKTTGSVREAASIERQAQLRLSETKRRALQEIRDAYANFTSSLERTAALSKAVESSDESYQLQVQEYRTALVSNLDVLQALQQLQDARREMIQARYESKQLYWRLKAALGEKV